MSIMASGTAGAGNDAPLWVHGVEAFCEKCHVATGVGHTDHNTAAHGLTPPSEQG